MHSWLSFEPIIKHRTYKSSHTYCFHRLIDCEQSQIMDFLFGLLLPFVNTTSSILLLVIVGYVTYLYWYVKKQHGTWERKGVKHFKGRLYHRKIDRPSVELQQMAYNHFADERYYGLYYNLQPALMIRDPDLIKYIAVKEFDHFVDRNLFVNHSDPLWSRNLFSSRGDRWRDLRATVSPSFTSSKMKFMFDLMEECVLQFVDFFKSDPCDVVELEMKETWRRFTNDVIASTTFGIKTNSLKDRNNEFFLMGTEVTDFGRNRFLRDMMDMISPKLSKLLKIRFVPAHLADFFSQIIKSNIKTREEKKIIRPDMIHLLMEAKKGRQQQEEEDVKVNEGFSRIEESEELKNRRKQKITSEDIVALAFNFYFAGFDTVSTLLTFVTYELAVHPDIQTRLREEIEGVGKITYESLLSLKYLDMVMSESLRKWPIAVLGDRAVTKPITIPPVRPGEKPLYLEKGLSCWFPLYALHRDPKLYPDPDQFDPERFNDENRRKIHPYAYLPFGAGPRGCIGSRFALLECKLVIAHVLKNFEIVPVARTLIPMVLDCDQPAPAAKGGMWLGLKKIK